MIVPTAVLKKPSFENRRAQDEFFLPLLASEIRSGSCRLYKKARVVSCSCNFSSVTTSLYVYLFSVSFCVLATDSGTEELRIGGLERQL